MVMGGNRVFQYGGKFMVMEIWKKYFLMVMKNGYGNRGKRCGGEKCVFVVKKKFVK